VKAIKRYLFRQFCRPSGVLGRMAGWSMALKNRTRNEWLSGLVQPQYGDRLLEIGFGPGTVIESLLEKEPCITIWGIDHSEVMVRQAVKRNIQAVDGGKVILRQASAQEIEFPGRFFDIVYGGNVHLFWKNPIPVYRAIYSMLKPEGTFILVYQPRSTPDKASIQGIADEIQSHIESASFQQLERCYTWDTTPPCLGIVAQKMIAPISTIH